MRVGVLASGEGTNLQALLDRMHGREVEFMAVGSDRPSARALERAHGAGIPTRAFANADFAGRAARDQAMADWLGEFEVELVVLAGYMAILDDAFLRRFADRVVNVHPSLLPAFPGVRAIEQALDYGAKVFGVTVHLVEPGAVDGGAIIFQRAIELPDAREPDEVLARLRPLEHELLPRAVAGLAAGAIRRDPDHPRRVIVDASFADHSSSSSSSSASGASGSSKSTSDP